MLETIENFLNGLTNLLNDLDLQDVLPTYQDALIASARQVWLAIQTAWKKRKEQHLNRANDTET